MPKYAETTQVSSAKSRDEIEKTLTKYGARSFAYGWNEDGAMVGFIMRDRQIRFHLPLPDRNSREFTHTPERKNRRSDAAIEAAYEQSVRQRWRALALVVKAKLEAVEREIVSFDEEFGMHFVLPNGMTVADWVAPQFEVVYETGTPPALLPGMDGPKAIG